MVAYEHSYQSFVLSKFEIIAIIISFFVFIFGFLLTVSTIVFDYMTYRWERQRAIQIQDEMMPPPRCKQKAEELGYNPMDWKDYFARDEPFIDTD
uniref:Uncharacterized protein n=2 Tax=Wuchereria bancrofti TaxID=6293 RepID=A0AAF5PUX0_WUCBA